MSDLVGNSEDRLSRDYDTCDWARLKSAWPAQCMKLARGSKALDEIRGVIQC